MKLTALLSILVLVTSMAYSQVTKNTPAAKVIETIIEKTGANKIPNTVDVIKEGDPNAPVKGIVTTMFATMDVLKKAIEKNCNLIIVHEPLYYNHADETARFAGDPVFLEKQKFIRDNNLVIWRFHDYIHSIRPDGIEQGMVEKLGWKANMVNGQYDNFTFSEMTLEQLLANLKKTFPKNSFYVVGDKKMKLKNVRLAPGAPGSPAHIRLLENKDVDVVIAGEAQQWETYEYARDAVSLGRNKAIIFLGHIASEEAGMDWCASWLKGFIKDIPVYFIESGPAYWSY
jgi:putative NIF3 family GTP cyclohydrolase 1 type 2